MNAANIDEAQADDLTNNIMMVLDGIKPHTAMASVSQVIKILSLMQNMSFEDMINDLTMINDVLYDNSSLQRVENAK